MALGGFGGGRNNGLRKTLVFFHAVGHRHTTYFTRSGFVGAPGTSRQVAANDHLNRIGFAQLANGDHGIG